MIKQQQIESYACVNVLNDVLLRGGARNVRPGGLKYGFQGTIDAENLRKNSFFISFLLI